MDEVHLLVDEDDEHDETVEQRLVAVEAVVDEMDEIYLSLRIQLLVLVRWKQSDESDEIDIVLDHQVVAVVVVEDEHEESLFL